MRRGRWVSVLVIFVRNVVIFGQVFYWQTQGHFGFSSYKNGCNRLLSFVSGVEALFFSFQGSTKSPEVFKRAHGEN